MARHVSFVVVLWVLLIVLGEALIVGLDFLPFAAAEQARVVDGAFRTLLMLAVPVVAFVFAVLIYAIPRFRSRGTPSQDGPPIHSHRGVVAAWFAVTTGLTIFMIAHPGLTGMAELRAREEEEADLVVEVEGLRFLWKIAYPEQKVTTFTELVLPVGKRVRFDITSSDVLHSFWIPAFRVKIDAVPGLVTHAYATPNKTGTFQTDAGMRLQCAELCGAGHGIMTVPVRVVGQPEFDAWVAEHKQ